MKKVLVTIWSTLIFTQVNSQTIYFTDGDAGLGYVVDPSTLTSTSFSLSTGSLSPNPDTASGASNGYPIIVRANELVIAARNSQIAETYNLEGVRLDTFLYPDNTNFDQLLDGTTDGTYNYAIRCCSAPGAIVRAGVNWENPEILFNLDSDSQGGGVTYDTQTKTLWVGTWGGKLINFSMTGEKLAEIQLPDGINAAGGLSFDPSSKTLWFVQSNKVYNFNRAGNLIAEYVFASPIGSNIFGGEILLTFGPSVAATRISMSSNAGSIRRIFGMQTAAVNPGLSYDCSLFDTRGICISFGGKRTNTSGEGGDATAGVLVAGYRLNPNVRIGGFIDQRTGTTTAPGLRLKNSNPELGLYAVWAERNNNEGLYARAALRFGKNDITITRPGVVDSEPGEGTAKFESQAAQITVGRGYRIAPNWVAAPHIGLRYVNIQRGSYSEAEVAGVVDNPLSYSRLKQESYTGVLGVAFTGDIAERTRATFTAGIDHDFRNRISDYSATGVTDLTAIKFDDEGLRKTRPVVSAELAYSLDKTSQISAKLTYREEAFKSIATTTGFVSYTKGF